MVINRLNERGYEAFAVGGCVRDGLLGIPAKDWDVCTNALPQEILAAFADFHTIPTGIQHGTVTVVAQGQPVEVTTYRIDGDYSDSRHPDGVTFTPSLQEDLARRDFTVNAMAYHPDYGLVDLYGGQQDLADKRIRCVGESAKRFSEDALRILRGLRFASVLDFTLTEDTVAGMVQTAPLLQKVAAERVYQELSKLVCGKAAPRILKQYKDLLLPMFPFVEESRRDYDALSRLPDDLCIRLAFLYLGNPKVAQGMKALRAPTAVVQRVALLAQEGEHPLCDQQSALCRAVFRWGGEATGQLAQLQAGLGACPPSVLDALHSIKEQNVCCSLDDLAVKGNHLLAAGIPAGPTVGQTLQTLLFAVMDGKVENRTESLLAYLNQL